MTHRLLPTALCLTILLGGCAAVAEQPPLDRSKSVTIYPVLITPAENIPQSMPQRMAEVVGTMLERGGMEQIELSQTVFTPPQTENAAELAEAFGRFIKTQDLKTEDALFGHIFGTPQSGPEAIHTMVVDKTGKTVFADIAGQETFSRGSIRPENPMTACMFIVDRLGQVWSLADPGREDAPQGKMAELMRQRSGVPPEAEIAAMNTRLQAAKSKIAASQVTVFPIHLWTGWDSASAVDLARRLNQQRVCRAVASADKLQLEIKGDPNEQKVLWNAARAFRDYLRQHPPATEYALLADYGLPPSEERPANHVHVILCEKSGDWVLVDYQNSHHPDYQRLQPQTPVDCNRLATQRLQSRLQP